MLLNNRMRHHLTSYKSKQININTNETGIKIPDVPIKMGIGYKKN